MKKLFLLSVSALFFLFSCKKEITQVQQVNQAYSAVYTIAPGEWSSADGGISYSAELDVPELDNIIYKDGAVLAYLSFSGTSYYEALPQVFDGITYGAIHGKGFVNIDMSALSGNTINPPGQVVSVKIILIDAQRLALRRDINLRDMQAVERALNIKDSVVK